MLPVSVWKAAGGRGWDRLLLGVVYGHIDPAACQAGMGRGEARAGQQAEGWLENLQPQEEVAGFQACGIFLWACK